MAALQPSPSILSAILLLVTALSGLDAYRLGDQVPSFKRTAMENRVSVWSDLLVGTAPIFGLDFTASIEYKARFIAAPTSSVKMQLAIDEQKFTSEWIMVADGKGNQLHELTVVVYHAGGAIHEVEWKKAYVVDDSSKENQEHRDRIYITYRWIPDSETDTRTGLDFLFMAGLAVSFGSFLAMSLDSTKELMNDRALVVPEYEEQSGRRRPRVKRFVMHPATVEGKESVQQNYIELEDQAEGGRLSVGVSAGSAGADVGKGKGD